MGPGRIGRTGIHFQRDLVGCRGGGRRPVGGVQVGIEHVIQGVLLDVRQDQRTPSPARRGLVGCIDHVALGQVAVGVVVAVHAQADLLEVVLALGTGGGRTDLLHRGQQQSDQDRDDGNDHQQLDQGKPRTAATQPGMSRSHRTSFVTKRTRRQKVNVTPTRASGQAIWSRFAASGRGRGEGLCMVSHSLFAVASALFSDSRPAWFSVATW